MAQAAIIGFDTASTITEAVLRRAVAMGVGFVGIYYKYMTPELVALVSRYGLKIISIYETTAQRALGGAVAGDYDGRQALALAHKFGQLVGAVIMFTADWDEQASQNATVLAYLTAAKAALNGYARIGIYGNGALCQAMLDAGVADLTWLAGGSGMRDTKAFAASGRATIVQDVGDKRGLDLGIDIDSDVALVEDYGGWTAVAAAPVVQPAPAPLATALSDVMATAALLQTQLHALGYYQGAIDSAVGPGTSDAAMAAYRAYKEGTT